jgi:hypothetical protein
VGVRVPHCLASLRAGVEHYPVPGLVNAFRHRYAMRLGHYLIEQAISSIGQRGHVCIVLPRYDKDMRWRLGIDVAERYGPVAL